MMSLICADEPECYTPSSSCRGGRHSVYSGPWEATQVGLTLSMVLAEGKP